MVVLVFVIVGLASYGRATYETEYNGGMGSNGLTSARHDVFANYLAQEYPCSFDSGVPSDLVYTGRYRLTDTVDIEGYGPTTMGKLVLSPTRTYAPVVKDVLRECRAGVHGMVHCSGGGQTKILHFINDLHIIKDNLFDIPPLFRIIQQESCTPWEEMFQVFNMGHRMELYADPAAAQEIIAISQSYGIDARVIGRVEQGDAPMVTIMKDGEEYAYLK